MRSLRFPAFLLVAALVLVPSLARAAQKLDRRPDLKPSASFRDVDCPPKPVLGQIDLTVSLPGSVDVPCDGTPHEFVDAGRPAASHSSTDRRCQALRAPPAFLLS
jgi:hypothetical protein